MMFLSFRREFAAMHPAWPPHYLFLARRVFGALVRNNQLKVGGQVAECGWALSPLPRSKIGSTMGMGCRVGVVITCQQNASS